MYLDDSVPEMSVSTEDIPSFNVVCRRLESGNYTPVNQDYTSAILSDLLSEPSNKNYDMTVPVGAVGLRLAGLSSRDFCFPNWHVSYSSSEQWTFHPCWLGYIYPKLLNPTNLSGLSSNLGFTRDGGGKPGVFPNNHGLGPHKPWN